MKKLSIDGLKQLKTSEQLTKEKVCELSGLPIDVVNDIYPNMSDKYFGNMTDKQIIDYYGNLIAETELKTKTEQEIKDKLFNFRVDDLLTTTGQNDFMEKFEMLSSASFRLELIKNIIVETSKIDSTPKYGTVLKPLYESLQSNLEYNSTFYSHDNTYNMIMNNLNRIVEEKQLKEKMLTDDNDFYYGIMKNISLGVSDPFYTNMDNMELVLHDKQGLLFDLCLFVNKYIILKEYDLKFVANKKIIEYRATANNMISSIISSMYGSRILGDKTNEFKPSHVSNVIDDLTYKIDEGMFARMGVDLYAVEPKAIHDALNLIHSMKHHFSIPIRKNISMFVTKARLLATDVDNARMARKQAGF